MSPLAQRINGWLRKVPAWPGYILLLLPFVWWFYLAVSGAILTEPVRWLEHKLGLFAFQLLLASLLITPILHQFRINLIKFRRMIGLMAFYYVLLHFAVYLLLDNQLVWDTLVEDLTKRPYIIVGMLALLTLIPVAITSNDYMVRRLSAQRWKRVHQLVYVAVIAAGLHFLWLSKVRAVEPVIYLALAVALVAYRPLRSLRRRRVRRATA